MRFITVETWTALPPGAGDLFRRHEAGSLFLSRLWFETLSATALEAGQRMVLTGVVDGDDVLAILPLLRDDGDAWRSLGNTYTSHYTVLLGERDQDAALRCLVDGLRDLAIDLLNLNAAPHDDPGLRRLEAALVTTGFTCHRTFRFYNWIERLDGRSFEAYMAGRPGRLRSTIERKQRKLEREHGCTFRLTTDEGVGQALEDFKAVNRASWKAGERYQAFIERLVHAAAEAGWLRIATLLVGERPIASQIWFVAHRKANIFRLSFDEDWRRYSPGSILTRHMMQHVIDTDRVEEIDFLIGNDAYKRDWMSERRECEGLICQAPPPERAGGLRRLFRLGKRI
ncbi:MAG: GNAT family N-acetyltransferase [Chromatiales bacterium]|nr:GNAT family N-acetyltransferase [Gammaproteobacteria bacterium]MCP5352225.1 GNAT family N-acetyltransferase [Chromatiales bacterium]